MPRFSYQKKWIVTNSLSFRLLKYKHYLVALRFLGSGYFMSKKNTNKRIRRSKPNYIYAIISVALVLFLLGFFGLLVFQTQTLITSLKEQVNVLVEFKPETERSAINVIKNKLMEHPQVKPSSVSFISKETALQNLKEELGSDFVDFDFQNPLYDMVQFNVKSAFMTNSTLHKFKANLIQENIVNDVYYQEGLVSKIADNLGRVSLIALISGLLLLLVAITLIHNTIKLALYANRFIIKNMELVGATWQFISWPYILKSLKNGLLSGILAIIMLVALLYLIQQNLPGIWDASYYPAYTILFSTLIIIGMLISGLSTFYVVNKYLKMRLDDLY